MTTKEKILDAAQDLIQTPDLETLEKALAEPEAAEAEAYDGVDPDTIKIFVAE